MSLALRRTVALHLAVILLLLPPLFHVNQARAEVPGIKQTIVVGGAAVGGIALLSWLFKKGGETAIKAGAKAGVTGMLGGLFGKPWILIPVVVGVGLMGYYLWQKYYSPAAYGSSDWNRYSQTDGRRYENPANRQQVYGNQYGYLNPYDNVGLAGAAAWNPAMNSAVGANGQLGNAASVTAPPSWTDQIKSALSLGQYRSPSLAAASGIYPGATYAGGTGGLNLGGNAAFAVHAPPYVNGLGTAAVQGPNGISGTAFDLPNIGDPARLGRVDSVGRGLTNGDETLTLNRTALFGANAPVASDSLAAAQAARDEAYTRMVGAMKDGGSSADAQKAIANFRAADEALKAKQATASR